MLFLYEFFPVLLFFLAFKFYDIYVATWVGIFTTLAQVIIHRCWKKQWNKQQLITLVIFVIFGSMTLYFHDPIFVKWKPTIVFWIFALVLLGSRIFTKKPLMQRFLEKTLAEQGNVPHYAWHVLNTLWAVFFLVLGLLNLYVAYTYDDKVWVNFKFYGVTGLLFVFSIFQALYLTRYLSGSKSS